LASQEATMKLVRQELPVLTGLVIVALAFFYL
jgi:hypothetical protein